MGAVSPDPSTPVDLERVPGARPIPWGSCFWPQARRLRSQSREPRPPSSGIFRRADALWAVRARCASTLEQNISVRVRKRSRLGCPRLSDIFSSLSVSAFVDSCALRAARFVGEGPTRRPSLGERGGGGTARGSLSFKRWREIAVAWFHP